MMKNILIGIIKIYQRIPGSFHGYCKQVPSCSSYAIEAIDSYGAFKGSYLSIQRILRCSPLGTFGYDPVPKKENKNEKQN